MEVTRDVSKFSGELKAGGNQDLVESRRLQVSGSAAELMSNMSLMSVTLEVSKLSDWLNFVAPCDEPNGGHAHGARGRTEGGRVSTSWLAERGSRGAGWGEIEGGASERTLNMPLISVTPEVFQAETSLLKSSLPEKSPLILVTPDTSQVSMGPNVAVALVESLLKA